MDGGKVMCLEGEKGRFRDGVVVFIRGKNGLGLERIQELKQRPALVMHSPSILLLAALPPRPRPAPTA